MFLLVFVAEVFIWFVRIHTFNLDVLFAEIYEYLYFWVVALKIE